MMTRKDRPRVQGIGLKTQLAAVDLELAARGLAERIRLFLTTSTTWAA